MQIIGTRDERVIGRLDLVAGRLETRTGRCTVLWGSALYVPEEHRETLMGVKLVLKQQGLNPTVASCGISRQAYPVFAGLKWIDLPMPRWVLVCRSRPVVERYMGTGPTGRVARPLADVGLRAHGGALSLTSKVRARGLACEQSAAMPPELDPLLQGGSAPVRAHRSAAWVNWLVRHSFHGERDARRGLFLVRDSGGDIVAYFLVKCRRYEDASSYGFRSLLLGTLGDWAIFDQERVGLGEIALLAVGKLARWGVDAIEICVPPDASGTVSLGRLGFVRAGDLHLMVRGSSASPLVDGLRDLSRWYVRPAEGDNFFS